MTTVRTTDDPVILTVRSDWPDGNHMVKTLVWGLYDLETIESSNEPTGSPTDYSVAPSAMPQPTAETRVTFPRVAYPGGFSVPVNREVYHMGSLGQVTLAGCSYRAFEITLETTNLTVLSDAPLDDPERAPRVREGWAYLVDIGFAVDSWFNPFTGRELAPDVIAIEAVH